MSALDASFLAAESARTPMHVGSLSMFEGASFFDSQDRFRIEAVREHVNGRLHLLPKFRRKVVPTAWGHGRPVWVDDERFDIANHVLSIALPAPATREQLAELCCKLQMRVLDRSRPLWQLWFVHGLDDGSVALIEKAHHAMIDGISGVEVAAVLLDSTPGATTSPAARWQPAEPPDRGQLLALSALERVGAPVRYFRVAQGLVRSPQRLGQCIIGIADAAADQRRILGTRRQFTRRVGLTRTLKWLTIPIGSVKASAAAQNATINDVILAAVAGASKALLAAHDVDPTGYTLQAVVPASTRTPDQRGRLGNQVSAILLPVRLDMSSPQERLTHVAAEMARHKRRHQVAGIQLAIEGLELLTPFYLAATIPLVHHQPFVDLIVTNVPGPDSPLYFDRARLIEAVPIVPLGGNIPVEVAVLSYVDQLTIGVYADGSDNSDAADFAEAIGAELATLRLS